MAAAWLLALFQLTPMSSSCLTLGLTGNLPSLPRPAQRNLRNNSWKGFGCSGGDAQEGEPTLGLCSGNRGRDLGTAVTNITCTLWNGPRGDRRCPSAGGTRATSELPKVSWLADGDTAGKGKVQHGSHLKWGKSSCWFGMLAKTGQEQLGK